MYVLYSVLSVDMPPFEPRQSFRDWSILQPCKLLNGAIPAQVAMASAVASLSSPPAMGVQWSNGARTFMCVCVHARSCMCVCLCARVCVHVSLIGVKRLVRIFEYSFENFKRASIRNFALDVFFFFFF